MKYTVLVLSIFFGICQLSAETKRIELKFIETSDIHGNYLPYDYIDRGEAEGSLARVYSYVKQEREKYGKNLFLFDNGDILEGQPTSYYYNYIDTTSKHLAADIMNYMSFDLGNIGNHDVEAGLPVMNRWVADCDFPVLGANIIWESTGEVYTKPYVVFERESIRIAVLGMITPAVPGWVSKDLWKGLQFEDMEECTRRWVEIIREEEKPDILIGLFHSGKDARMLGNKYREDASVEVARRVPGFDLVMMGHDHTLYCEKVVDAEGDSVLVVNPGCDGLFVSDITMELFLKDGKIIEKRIEGSLVDIGSYGPDAEMVSKYQKNHLEVDKYVSQKIGTLTETITSRPAYFGPSAFVDFIHMIQLDITGADISFASPLSFDTSIREGDIRIYDMFNIYRYKNLIYTMLLTGEEIKDYLEASYGIWTNQMKSREDHLLLFDKNKYLYTNRRAFANYYFYFDSAAGILYTVDVSKPIGEKVTILSMSDGRPFDPAKKYKVAITSYRGNGGGQLLTNGAGLSIDELDDRTINISPYDFRYYLIEYIKENKVIHPEVLDHWKFIPESWVKSATQRDYNYLFGEETDK